MKIWLIKKLGLRDEVLTQAVRKLYNTIGPEDILKQNTEGQWIVEGRVISEAEKQLLISVANQFLSTKLWKVLVGLGNKKMYIESRSVDDITFGKMWTYT